MKSTAIFRRCQQHYFILQTNISTARSHSSMQTTCVDKYHLSPDQPNTQVKTLFWSPSPVVFPELLLTASVVYNTLHSESSIVVRYTLLTWINCTRTFVYNNSIYVPTVKTWTIYMSFAYLLTHILAWQLKYYNFQYYMFNFFSWLPSIILSHM